LEVPVVHAPVIEKYAEEEQELQKVALTYVAQFVVEF